VIRAPRLIGIALEIIAMLQNLDSHPFPPPCAPVNTPETAATDNLPKLNILIRR
jgi:hypothetical protein